jgi:F-box/leucine-rich repeat protein 2/20
VTNQVLFVHSQAAIARCSLLQNLDMRGVGATSAGLHAMAQGCARLKDLDIKFCTSLGDDALQHLVDHCPVLKQLHMSCCNFSDAGLVPLAQCHTLQVRKRSF